MLQTFSNKSEKCLLKNYCFARRTYNMRRRKPIPVFIIVCCASIFLIVFGIIMLSIWPLIKDYVLKNEFVLRPGSRTLDMWKENPIPMHLDFYLFNWTNPEDVYDSSIKPRFQQIGPYSYDEVKKKVNIVFHENNKTLTYRQMHTWFFSPEKSKGSVYDAFTTINPVSVSAAYATRYWSIFMKKGLSVSINTFAPTVHLTRSVGDILFNGYDDPLISMARSMPFMEAHIPPYDKFAWFYTRNNSIYFDGIFNSGTGQNKDLNVLYKWNNWTHTPYFPGECGKVEGSAGELFPQNLKKDHIKIFASEICKTVKFDFKEITKVENILGYKYVVGRSFLDNGTLVPENSCNCQGDCLPSGVLNVSTCRYGSPGFVSLPHFLKADPSYLEAVEGLDPNVEQHEFYAILEPETAIPLEVAARFQLNLYLQPISDIGVFVNVSKIMFPMLWFEQKVKIPSDVAFKLKLLIHMPEIFTTIAIISITIGVLAIVGVTYKICTTKICSVEQKQILREQVPLNQEGNVDKIRIK